MKLYSYGDSWTAGEGSSSNKDEWNNHSWINIMSEKISIECINKGISGNSNFKIFNSVIKDVRDGVVKSDDVISISWSSSLRDIVPFLPNDEWISWSIKHLVQFPEKFFHSLKTNENKYFEFIKEFKILYVSEMFNQSYYNIINQNYIIFLQRLFDYYGIKYFMSDSIEKMIINVDEKDNKTHLINKKTYWNFTNKSMRDFLFDMKRNDVWEYGNLTTQNTPSIHPNKLGYELISEEMYRFYTKLYN